MDTGSVKWDKTVDVLIIGSGFAGLAAAIEAKDAGASVIILEKMPYLGGNSIISAGYYGCVDPERQKAQGIEDSVELHYEQTLAGGDYEAEPSKVRYMVEHALEGWQWLEDMGVKLVEPIFQLYGAVWPRTHSPGYKRRRGGAAIVAALYDRIVEMQVPVLLQHSVIRIVREQPLAGRVLGVEVVAENRKLNFRASKALILASGGFCADISMRMKYDPRFDDRFTTSNHAGATGEVLTMAVDIGAGMTGMEHIQAAGPIGRDIRFLKRPAGVRKLSQVSRLSGLSTNSTLYLNLQGERIAACDARRDDIAEAIMKTPEKVCYILNDLQGLGSSGRAFGEISLESAVKLEEKHPGEIFMADTIGELALKMGVVPDVLEKTVRTYNSYVDAKYDPDFHQALHNLLYKIEIPPYFASSGSPAVHYMCGGLRTDTATCQVIDRLGQPIRGLYAAGEVVGGVHGANRLGGNAIADCIVFGRLAGKTVARTV
jgi:urocanate reductase